MKIVKLNCDNCGASLEANKELKTIFCNYCGAEFLIDDGSINHTYRKVDEARIKEAEISEKIRLKELEMEERKREKEEKSKRTKIIASIILAIVGILFFMIGTLGGEASGNSDSAIYSLAFLGIMALLAIFYIWIGINK